LRTRLNNEDKQKCKFASPRASTCCRFTKVGSVTDTIQGPKGLLIQSAVNAGVLARFMEKKHALGLGRRGLISVSYMYVHRHLVNWKYGMLPTDQSGTQPLTKFIRLSPTGRTQIRDAFLRIGHAQRKALAPKTSCFQQRTQKSNAEGRAPPAPRRAGCSSRRPLLAAVPPGRAPLRARLAVVRGA